MKAGTRLIIFTVLISLTLLITFKFIINPTKVDVSKIESIKKPSGVEDIKVESHSNIRKISITVNDNGIKNAEDNAEKIFNNIKREDGSVYMFEIIDKNGKVLEMGLILLGEDKITWN